MGLRVGRSARGGESSVLIPKFATSEVQEGISPLGKKLLFNRKGLLWKKRRRKREKGKNRSWEVMG